MKRKQASAAPPPWLALQQRTDWIKLGLVIGFNVATFLLAWAVNRRPAADLTRWPFALLLESARPGLRPLVTLFLNLLGLVTDGRVLRYLMAANVVAVIPLVFAARFVQHLYRFQTLGRAIEYLALALTDPALYSLGGDDRVLEPDLIRPGGGDRSATVQDGRLTLLGKEPRNLSLALAGGPGRVLVPPEYAAQLERGGRLTRAVGSCLVRLRRFERVYKVFDLRQIVRSATLTAHTRDGIPVEIPVTVYCQVRSSRSSTDRSPYPFDRSAVRHLTLNTLVDASSPLPWEDMAIDMAEGVLSDVVGSFRLDELFEPLRDVEPPRITIQGMVHKRLREGTRHLGIDVTHVWLGEFQLPTQVTDQFLDYWRADWQRRTAAQLADGEAAAIRELGRARSQAQGMLIQTMIAAFQSAHDARVGVDTKQTAALCLIDGLEKIFRQSSGSSEADSAYMRSLERLRRAIQAADSQAQVHTEEREHDAAD